MTDHTSPDDVDPRRAMWRRGSYEIVGDWIRSASVSILDRVEEVSGTTLNGQRLLDLGSGTGAVSIAAAHRGAQVVGVDLTDELVEIARRRAAEAEVGARFVVGDFDHLDDAIGDLRYDVVTSSFGLIFAPEAAATLAQLAQRVDVGGVVAVTGWDPDGVFIAPERMIELFPERPPMLDMGTWTTGIADLCSGTPFDVGLTRVDDLVIPFDSVQQCADELERWSGGWTQLFETFDALGVADEARVRFRAHLDSFTTPVDHGIGLTARYHTSVLRRVQ